MIKPLVILAACAMTVATCGCRHNDSAMQPTPLPELSLEQRRDMQGREWDAPMDIVFASTISVMQDLGWTLEVVDRSAGIIRASTGRRLDVFGPEDEKALNVNARREKAKERSDVSKKWTRWKEAVVHMEPWGDGKSRQRIVLNLRGTLPSMSYIERQDGGVFRRGRDVMINAPAVEQSVEVELPEAYSDMFDRVDVAVGQRVLAK